MTTIVGIRERDGGEMSDWMKGTSTQAETVVGQSFGGGAESEKGPPRDPSVDRWLINQPSKERMYSGLEGIKIAYQVALKGFDERLDVEVIKTGAETSAVKITAFGRFLMSINISHDNTMSTLPMGHLSLSTEELLELVKTRLRQSSGSEAQS